MKLTLIQRDECHRCAQAWGRLAAAGVPACDPPWADERIPVLRREDTGAELDWPFDAAAVRAFVAR